MISKEKDASVPDAKMNVECQLEVDGSTVESFGRWPSAKMWSNDYIFAENNEQPLSACQNHFAL